MGIENVDDLKPNNNVEEIHPEWPMVRCVKCRTVYENEIGPREIAPGVYFHTALKDCPKCGHSKFYTKMDELELNAEN
jgi:NAD-dependent SIR2 family protein deacetylase